MHILFAASKERKSRNHRNDSASPILLLHLWDPSTWEVADSGSIPSFLGCNWAHFSQGMTSINSLPSSPRQNFASPFLLMLYAAATPNNTPAAPNNTLQRRCLRNSREMRYLRFRAQYSEYFVHYPKKQIVSRADQAIPTLSSSPLPGGKSRIQCLIQQLPSNASDMCCESWARDRRE